MPATLVNMGYRGEDASRARAESRRQSLWPSSTEPGATGSWNDGSRNDGQDDEYAPADGYGGYPRDDSHAGYEQYSQGTGYGQPADHRQQAGYDGGDAGNGDRDGYGPGAGYGEGPGYDAAPRYGEGPGYGQYDDYGSPQGNYSRDNGHTSGDGYPAGNGYGQGEGYLNDGYAHRNGYPQDGGYGHGGGYPQDGGYGHGDGYGRTGGYPAGAGYVESQGHGGYGRHDQAGYEARTGSHGDGYPVGDFGDTQYEQPRPGTTNYDADYRTGGYGGSGGYPALPPGGHAQSGGYPAQSGGYPALPPGGHAQSGGYPAQSGGYGQSGDYPAQDTRSGDRADVPGRYAGNDWYGGQPEAASGSGFADTGTYTMDARMIESYGTGPRPADYGTGGYAQSGHEPNGYEPNGYGQDGYGQDGYHDGYQGSASGELAVHGFPPSAAPLPALAEGAAPQGLVHTGQQERYEDQHEAYPGYEDRGEFNDRQGYDDYDEPAGFGARGYAPVPGNDVPDDYDDYADGGDPYEDRYGTDGAPTWTDDKRSKKGKTGENAKTGRGGRDGTGRKRGKRPLVLSALAVVAVGVLVAAAYVFLLKPKPSSNGSTAAAGPLPTTGSTSAVTAQCVKQFGQYCHIELRTDDPTPLTLDELFPPQFQNETDHKSLLRAATRLDKKCANAVIGPDLVSALQSGKCTQVLRASYVSGDNTIMGTIGVVNLGTTNEAHYAGKVVGANDFVAPLSSSKGIASKLGKGTGVVEAEFKGHYLILTWAEFTSTKAPTTKVQDQQLEHFENDLVAGTANISLSQRMVNGKPATAAG